MKIKIFSAFLFLLLCSMGLGATSTVSVEDKQEQTVESADYGDTISASHSSALVVTFLEADELRRPIRIDDFSLSATGKNQGLLECVSAPKNHPPLPDKIFIPAKFMVLAAITDLNIGFRSFLFLDLESLIPSERNTISFTDFRKIISPSIPDSRFSLNSLNVRTQNSFVLLC